MDDVELWNLASRAPEPARAEILEKLASGDEQRSRVAALLAQPAPRQDEGPRYEILGLVGAGTQGEVYRARRLDLDRECALKVLRNVSDPGFVERVRAEAGLMARVLSPHVVPVFDAGDLGDGRYFIEMALCADPDVGGLPGEIALARSLRAHVLENGPLTADAAARLLQPICAAVAAAHRAGVVHSDVKPENVLVLPVSRRAMLGDFGVAAVIAGGAGQVGAGRVGTVAYMAPEQFEGGAAPGFPSDVYGLGGSLLFALTGLPPHPERRPEGADPRGGQHLGVPPATPRSLAEVVDRALASDPRERPSAEEMAGALDAFLARRPTPWDLSRPGRRAALFYKRHRVLVNLAFAGTVVAATLGLGLLRTVVAKTGLEARSAELEARLSSLRGSVTRLDGEQRTLEADLSRLRGERDTIAGSEAREKEARLLAEGRSAEADAQLATALEAARDSAGRAEKLQASLAQAESRGAAEEARAQRLAGDLAGREAALRAAAEGYRSSVEALRQGWGAEAAAYRRDLEREREAAAGARQRLAEAERSHAAADASQREALAHTEGKLEGCRAERDDLRRSLAAPQAELARKPGPPAAPSPAARATPPRM